jgi:hypothetical protein
VLAFDVFLILVAYRTGRRFLDVQPDGSSVVGVTPITKDDWTFIAFLVVLNVVVASLVKLSWASKK